MTLFEWRDEYSVKIATIDAQHLRLVSILNAMHDGMTSGTGVERLGPLLDELVEYTVKHFAFEERLFAEHGYAQAEEHAQEHRRLEAKVLEFKAKYEAKQVSMNMELMRFLKDWLIKHILGSDRAYSAYLVDRGVE